jgi:hypothetical protein
MTKSQKKSLSEQKAIDEFYTEMFTYIERNPPNNAQRQGLGFHGEAFSAAVCATLQNPLPTLRIL